MFLFYNSKFFWFFKGVQTRKCSQKWVSNHKVIDNADIVVREVFALNYSVLQKQPPEMFYEKAVLKNFVIFTGKHLCWSLFLLKLQAFKSLLKRDSNPVVPLWILRNFSKTYFEKHLWTVAFARLSHGSCGTLLRARLHKTRSELEPVWNLKPLWNVVPFTWQFT